MGFVQSQFLGVLAALAIPVIVHLILRRQTRQVSLGTLRFLKIVLRENARRRRLKRWTLLALRLACITLLAGLFARPYLVAYDRSESNRFVAILIDRSASMQLKDGSKRLLDQAVEGAQQVIRRASDGTQVEAAFFDHAVRPVGARDGRTDGDSASRKTPRDLLAELVPPEKTYAATDYGAALAWARDVCVKSPQYHKELHIFTDLQRSGLDWSSAESLPPEIEVHLHDLGRDGPNNVALTAARPSRLVVRPGDAATVSATVYNAGPFPLEKVPVALHVVNGNRKYELREKITLEPGGTGSVQFELASLEKGLWQGTVQIEVDDDLAFDNRRFVAVLAAPQLQGLIVDGDPHSSPILAETYLLEMALRLALPGETFADSPFVPTTVEWSADATLPDLRQTDLVVLANTGKLGAADAQRLAEFVRGGGGLLVFTGENVQPESVRTLAAAGLAPGEMSGVARANELPFRLQQWEEKHPLFQTFDDPQHGDLRRLAFRAYTRIKPAKDSRVLALFATDEPAVLERPLGKGTVLWFASTCDSDWGDWTRSRLYLPFVHQMLGYLAGLAEGGPLREALIDAAGTMAGDAVPGVHDRGKYREVINVSPRESETDRCTREEFAKRFELKLHESVPAEQVAAAGLNLSTSTTELRDDEIWHWVVFVLLAVLFIENFLANRTAA